MNLEPEHCYRALLTHDARFDGRFFVGVSSTGIYCRPVCRVRTPKAANCTFYPSAAAAEQAGFRPCLRCRPERAPGGASVDASSRLAHTAAFHIDSGFLEARSVADLAQQLGISERHLRRVFADEFGVAPIQHAQTQKLLLARRLLRDTALPVIDIAYAAGFGSTRRLHTLFQKHYGVAPGAWRRRNPQNNLTDELSGDAIAIELAYRPPYAWEAQLDFLAGRAIAGVEAVIDGRYVRAVRLPRDGKLFEGWISVEHATASTRTRLDAPVRNSVIVRVAASLTPVIATICAKVRHLFDLGCDPHAIAEILGPLAAANPGLRVPGAFDGFEMAVRAILGQQISVAAARTLAGRIAARFGTAITTPFPAITHTFPSADDWPRDAADLSGVGITGSRIRALDALARHCADGSLRLEPTADVDATLAQLQALPGIGEWTAHYIAMRALAWPDAFLHTDYGVKKALGETHPQRVLARAEAWRPWRAYANRHLWQSLATPNATTKESSA